jgi:hypothetical protein
MLTRRESVRTDTFALSLKAVLRMEPTNSKTEEAAAIERVASAAREVQAASIALEERFSARGEPAPPTLPLARLTAAINELQAARDALDQLLARRSLH